MSKAALVPGSRLRWLTLGVLAAALMAVVPTVGDFGLTYDEPAYRYSQMVSAGWWERLGRARSAAELADLFAADSLLYYWPYARHGINFHPPLAGQANLLAWEVFSPWMKDIPARRMAQALEFVACLVALFHFLARRYGAWTGLAAASALLTMPRVYGQAHLIDTDLPAMAIWLFTALAFWKGLNDPRSRRWRIAAGVLAGLAFVEKLGAVFVLLPLLIWLLLLHLPRGILDRRDRAAWLDAALTTVALSAPLVVAYAEIRRLAGKLPPPQFTNLFVHDPPSVIPGAILLMPLLVWVFRRWLGRRRSASPVWGVERPALETIHAMLAFGPAVAWLGNPAWWRHAMVRLAHYYQLTTARRGALPDIQNIYFGQIYEFSLPWDSAWVLIGITVPPTLLVASMVGLVWGLNRVRTGDRLPLFFLLLFVTLPATRLFPTPAHDGVRLLLPCFPFLAAFAGWGTAWLGAACSRFLLGVRPFWMRALVAVSVLLPAAWDLIRIHPYELSYYNRLIGGPRGAWSAGFELAYWYDAFTPRVLEELNQRIPDGAAISYAHDQSNPVMVIQDLQATGGLEGSLVQWEPDRQPGFPYMWLLTHDSKAASFTRLLFAMTPWYESRPAQLDGLRVLTVADPVAVSRAWALQLLMHGPPAVAEPAAPHAPQWVQRSAPWLARLWGDGLTRVAPPRSDETILRWAEDDPEGLRAAARWIADREPADEHPGARRLMAQLQRDDLPGRSFSDTLLRSRPEAVYEAALILIGHGGAVKAALEHAPYLEPDSLGGYLDRDLQAPR